MTIVLKPEEVVFFESDPEWGADTVESPHSVEPLPERNAPKVYTLPSTQGMIIGHHHGISSMIRPYTLSGSSSFMPRPENPPQMVEYPALLTKPGEYTIEPEKEIFMLLKGRAEAAKKIILPERHYHDPLERGRV